MSSALSFDLLESGLATLTFDLPGKKVNLFNRSTLTELDDSIRQLADNPDIRCLVLLSGKPDTFIAGADVDLIGAVSTSEEAEAGSRLGQELFSAWDSLPFPTVAAVDGTCLGGGTELALASDFILVSDRSALRIGLPEVRLGIVPAWGGCTRLPRRCGIAAALDIILAGKAVNGRKAFRIGLADALLPQASFRHHVRDFARQVMAGSRPPARRGKLADLVLEKNPIGRRILFDQARKQVLKKTGGHYPAPLRALEVVRVGIDQGFDAGLRAEARAIGELAVSPVCKNLIHVFHLMEDAKRGDGGEKPRPLRRAAVLGAGVMGGGIAQLIADRASVPVRLKDLAPEPLAQGMAHAARLFRKQVQRRRMTEAEAKEKMNLLLPALSYAGFGNTDFVIEAIVENLEIKQKVFEEVAKKVPAEAILASNTSSLSIDLIGKETPGPERVVGMHFFNPVDKMPLVEVIAGPSTSPEVVQAAAAFARRLGKTAVVVQDGPGFLVNRLLMFYLAEALWLLEEGQTIEVLDRVMTDWGMPMGPMALIDEVGIDVALKVAPILAGAFSDRLTLPGWLDRLGETDRLGTKTGKGLYLYQGGRRTRPDPGVYGLAGLGPRTTVSDPPRLVDRMVLPMVNEAARCLDEGLVTSPGELDLALILGTGFPPFRGGLCRWADRQGPARLADEMTALATEVGGRFTPSGAFSRVLDAGGFYAAFGQMS